MNENEQMYITDKYVYDALTQLEVFSVTNEQFRRLSDFERMDVFLHKIASDIYDNYQNLESQLYTLRSEDDEFISLMAKAISRKLCNFLKGHVLGGVEVFDE